jgi:beta-glucosidase
MAIKVVTTDGNLNIARYKRENRICSPFFLCPNPLFLFSMKSVNVIVILMMMVYNASSQNLMNDAENKARATLAKMRLQQKINEMRGHGLLRFGFSMVFGNKVKPIKAGGDKSLGIPATVFYDGPRGIAAYKGATAFPVTMARGASWDRDLEYRLGEAMAKENRALGGNYSGAVCMNLLRHPAWGRAQETYGEDSYHVGEMAVALVNGIQKHNVQACAKHFAANSMENNRFGGSMNMDERTLHEVYLPHFKKVVDHGVASIMSAYNQLNGEFCGHSKLLLTTILREQWGFKGYVTSDWMYGLYDAEKGIKAGMNVEMPSGKVYANARIKKLLKAGRITMQDIDELVLPILRTKYFFANRTDAISYPKEMIGCTAHAELAQEAAEKSAVLLKNDRQILPISKECINKIAVIGSLADSKETGDRGSSGVTPHKVISPLQGIQSYLAGTNVEVVSVNNKDNAEAVGALCKSADMVVVVAGMSWEDEGEYLGVGTIRDKAKPDKKNFITRTGIMGLGGDRNYLHLHERDIETIQLAATANKNVIVCLVAGAAVTVEEWHEDAAAILQTFYNGQEGGTALARLLFGDVNPSGKLPFTVPKLESDLPPFNSFENEAEYGYYHGYTLLDKNKTEPRYPFGFGLSYTKFETSNFKMCASGEESICLSATVKNIGNKAGAEVLQIYISTPASEVDRPLKTLRGFEKVFLEPGVEKNIELKISKSELAYYNPLAKAWVIEKGIYHAHCGNSSANAAAGAPIDFEIK